MKTRVLWACFTSAVLFGGPASAAQVFADEEKGVSVNVGVLLQTQLQVTAPGSSGQGSAGVGAPDGKSPSLDFFARRIRLMSWGSVTKNLSYFVETDQPNFGKGGDFSSSMYIQDAFLTYTFAPELKIDAGMMLVPFARHTIEGAIGLNAIDYHADLIRLPAGKVWRDTGVQFRGLLVDNLIHYRLGVFEGARNGVVPAPAAVNGMPAAPRATLNDSGMPRFTGQVRVNVLGSEPDFFLKGIYFSAKPLVSIGVGADLQPKGVYKLDQTVGTYNAFSVDAFAELPLTPDDELIAKANVFVYGEGTSFIGGAGLPAGGTAFFAEAGFRHDWIEPLAYIEYLQGKNDSIKILAPHFGLDFWLTKHTFNVKADVGYRKTDTVVAAVTTTKKDIFGTVQAQLFF